METNIDIKTARKLFKFCLDILNFYEYMLNQNKKPIAIRVLTSTMAVACSYQKKSSADKRKEIIENEQNIIINLKNVIYWLEQCEKSGYWLDKKLKKNAIELQKMLFPKF